MFRFILTTHFTNESLINNGALYCTPVFILDFIYKLYNHVYGWTYISDTVQIEVCYFADDELQWHTWSVLICDLHFRGALDSHHSASRAGGSVLAHRFLPAIVWSLSLSSHSNKCLKLFARSRLILVRLCRHCHPDSGQNGGFTLWWTWISCEVKQIMQNQVKPENRLRVVSVKHLFTSTSSTSAWMDMFLVAVLMY